MKSKFLYGGKKEGINLNDARKILVNTVIPNLLSVKIKMFHLKIKIVKGSINWVYSCGYSLIIKLQVS